ncbi:MAG: alanine--glyoxylate aminotransferase family protein [Anaerolineaceae bacterium]|nr:alanine--glyoxylate aminotransferase family protein [Anaerolineaceae bacterium]
MKSYPIPMVPGPVQQPPEVLKALKTCYGSPDMETDFLELYNQTEKYLQEIYGTKNQIAILSGEGMLVLWAAIKNCLLPGDKVIAISTGLFGYGLGKMAQAIGADVRFIEFPFNETVHDYERIEQVISDFNPKMITLVHCETPSGTLNPIKKIGELKQKFDVPLLIVDSVASAGGAELKTDDWHIDMALGGSQKCMSAPASLSFTSISPAAWDIINQVNYIGYDSLKGFKDAQENFYFPYTPNWHGIAALNAGAKRIIAEGLENAFERHKKVAAYTRERLIQMGLTLFPAVEAIQSPTVTAVKVPDHIEWQKLDKAFRKHGLVVGGNYGQLAGKVFRLGHMGFQADKKLVKKALDIIENVMRKYRN